MNPVRAAVASVAAAVALSCATGTAARGGPFAEDVTRLRDPAVMDKVVKAGDAARADVLDALEGERPDLAAAAAGRMKLRAAGPALAALLDRPDGELRATAAWALGECGDGQFAPPLATLSADDPYPIARAAAVRAVAKLDPKRLEAIAAKAVADGDARVRLAAVHTVRNRPDDKALFRALLPLLEYRVERVPAEPEDTSKPPRRTRRR